MCDFGERADAAAGADGGAIESGSGAGKFELAGRGPVLEERVNERCVENIAGAGGVRDVDVERGGVVEIRAIKSEDAVVTERGGGEFVGEFFVDELESFWEIGFAVDAAGNVVTGDEVVDFGKKRVDGGVELVEVGNDRDF